MFRILLALLLMTTPALAITQWNKGAPAATDLKSIWPATSQANNAILDALLQNYQDGLYLTYTSATTLTVGAGEIVVSNVAGSIRLFLVSTTTSSITAANLDTGSIVASTTYYVYAGTSTATDSAPTYYISLSSSAPTGVTYYALIGSFTTDSNSQFTGIVNNNIPNGYVVGPPSSKSADVVYQALTDGMVTATSDCQGPGGNPHNAFEIISDSSSSPSNVLTYCNSSSSTSEIVLPQTALIRKGDYWEAKHTSGSAGILITWTPLGR